MQTCHAALVAAQANTTRLELECAATHSNNQEALSSLNSEVASSAQDRDAAIAQATALQSELGHTQNHLAEVTAELEAVQLQLRVRDQLLDQVWSQLRGLVPSQDGAEVSTDPAELGNISSLGMQPAMLAGQQPGCTVSPWRQFGEQTRGNSSLSQGQQPLILSAVTALRQEVNRLKVTTRIAVVVAAHLLRVVYTHFPCQPPHKEVRTVHVHLQ